jgi:hypothetical protein
LAFFVPVWIACFALHVKEVGHGRLARVPLFVSAPGNVDSYPILLGFWPGSPAKTASGLAVGDQLTRLGEADLRGVSPVSFLAQAYEQARGNLSVPITFVRAGQYGRAELHFDPFLLSWGAIPMILGFAVAAVLVLLRMPGSRPARAFFLACMSYSIHWCLFFGGPPMQTYAWVVVYFLSSLVILPFALRAVLVLPEEVAPTAWWMYAWPWLFALRGPTALSWYFGSPLPHEIGMRATNLLEFAFMATLLGVLTHHFHRAGPLGRRQLKWVVYGLYIGTVPVLATATIAILNPHLWWLQEVSMMVMVLTPICFFIAIVRFNLFDIDRLISTTAAYSLLLIFLGAGLLTTEPHLSATMSAAAGVDQTFGQAILSLFLVLVTVPGQRYLRPQIERLFFVERYALEKGIKQLLAELSGCEGPRVLFTRVGEGLYALLRPENCVLYGRTETAYVPLLVRGSVVPPTFASDSPLVSILQTRATSVDSDRWQRTVRTYLGQSERAALRGLRVAGVLPIRLGGSPIAFVCLGQKRSGDVYTATDFSLLSNVAEKVGQELRRFETADVDRQMQQMQNLRQLSESEVSATRRVNGRA